MAILILAFLSVLPAGPAGAQGFLLTPAGQVEAKSPGAARFVAVSTTTSIRAGTEVRTGRRGGAQLKLPDGSEILLAPLTDFVLKEDSRKSTVFGLLKGKLRAAITGLYSSKMRIETPTAVAAVRGTEFDVSAGAEGSQFDVAEGALEVSDKRNEKAMVTSEETMTVGPGGLTEPSFVGLEDPRAQMAARPAAVARETARERTRTMLEDLRHQELKANEAQLGRSVIDVNGNYVRIEEYLLRPASNMLKFLFLSHREDLDRLDWGYFQQTFHSALPDDLSAVPDIVSGSFFNPVLPANYITSQELYLTNTVDAFKEHTDYGAPVLIDFGGFNGGVSNPLYFPSYINSFVAIQTPGGPTNDLPVVTPNFAPDPGWYHLDVSHLDYGSTLAGNLTFQQYYVDSLGGFSVQYASLQFDPSDPVSVDNMLSQGYAPCMIGVCDPSVAPVVYQSFPSGDDQADQRTDTTYADGTTLGTEQFLINNDGSLVDLTGPLPNLGDFSIEMVVDSSLFQNGTIDVLIAPELFQNISQGPKADLLDLVQ